MSPVEKSDTIMTALREALRADVDAARARADDLNRELSSAGAAPSQPSMAFMAISSIEQFVAGELRGGS